MLESAPDTWLLLDVLLPQFSLALKIQALHP